MKGYKFRRKVYSCLKKHDFEKNAKEIPKQIFFRKKKIVTH